MKARHRLAALFSWTDRNADGLAGAFTNRSADKGLGTRMSWLRLPFALALASLIAAGTLLGGSALPAVSAAEACPNETLRSENESLALPDCRAYELVTPPFAGGQTYFQEPPGIAADGSAIVFQTLGAPGSSEADPSATGAAYKAEREPGGWSSTPLEPPSSLVENSGSIVSQMVGISGDLQSQLFLKNLRGEPNSGLQGIYYLHSPAGLTELGAAVPPALVAEQQPTSHLSNLAAHNLTWEATRNLSTVVFSNHSSSQGDANWDWPGDTTSQYEPSLYEYSGAGAEPLLVGVSNEGPLAGSPHINEGAHLISDCGVALGSGAGPSTTVEGVLDHQNAVSADGSVIFFTPNGPNQRLTSEGSLPGCTGSTPPAAELFARVSRSHTVAISEPTSADCAQCNTGAPADAIFQGASEDGSRAFFLTSQELLPGNPGKNLYEYDFGAPSGQKITAVSHLSGGGEAGVLGELALSNDGSHLYYVASGVATTDANTMGAHAQPGEPNLYVYDTRTAVTQFVATLTAEDASGWNPSTAERSGSVTATPDGRFLLFSSHADLTSGASGSGSHLYRYDAQTGALVRVSIGEGGFNQDGNVPAGYFFIQGSVESGATQSAPPTRSLSDDGAYVFFQSNVALTPGALESRCAWEVEGECFAEAANVYEYHAGHVYLISDGQDTHAVLGSPAVRLVGTDATGSNVFIETADPLVPGDTNSQKDIYDVRVGGGFPAPVIAVSCQRTANCQGQGSAPLLEPPPSSASFTGGGNPSAALVRALKACRARHAGKVAGRKQRRMRCEAAARKRHRDQASSTPVNRGGAK